MEKVNLTIFKEKNGDVVKGIAFMKCPYCEYEMCLTTDWMYVFCRKCGRTKKTPNVVYRLQPDKKSPEGFDRVEAVEVDTYNKDFLVNLSLEGIQ